VSAVHGACPTYEDPTTTRDRCRSQATVQLGRRDGGFGARKALLSGERGLRCHFAVECSRGVPEGVDPLARSS